MIKPFVIRSTQPRAGQGPTTIGLLAADPLGVGAVALRKTCKEAEFHQFRGLKSLPRLILGHLFGGQIAQLLVNQGQELLGRLAVAGFDLPQHLRDVAHRIAHLEVGLRTPTFYKPQSGFASWSAVANPDKELVIDDGSAVLTAPKCTPFSPAEGQLVYAESRLLVSKTGAVCGTCK
jgi:hypothetical protein